MGNTKKLIGICILGILVSCIATPQEKPAEMFINLYEKYKNTEIEKITLSQRSEGAGMYIFDINKKISKDLFCRVNLLGSLGQTQYLVYKKDSENIWYFHKEALFYEQPMELENAEIRNTYFKYIDNLPYAFNEATSKYDIQADTDKYQAIADVRSLAQLIEIIQNSVSK